MMRSTPCLFSICELLGYCYLHKNFITNPSCRVVVGFNIFYVRTNNNLPLFFFLVIHDFYGLWKRKKFEDSSLVQTQIIIK